MDRAHRHELKHDKFVEQVGHTVEYAAAHRQQVVRWAGLALVIILAAAGVYYWMRWQSAERQEALRVAIRTQEAQVGPQASEFITSFPSDAEKTKAVDKAWNDLATRYSGSTEASVAHLYMGINAADRGNTQEAEKHLKQVVDSGKEPWISQARLSLANIYEASGRAAEAEKLLRAIVDSPTVLVSKEQATLTLAKILAKSKPAEARKLLEPLRTERGAVSRAALTALNDLPAAQ